MNYKTELMESILTSPQAQKIIDYVSPIYGKSYVGLWLFQAIGVILDEGETFPEEFKKQVTPVTATWTVGYWENEYGIVPDPSWNIEQRRQNILATIKYKAPINPEKIVEKVTAITGLNTTIIENTAKNTFDVVVQGYSDNMPKAIEAIESMKPAHLVYNIRVSDLLQSKLNTKYKILCSEMENFNVSVLPKEPDLIVITDENGEVMTDENSHILID